MAVALSPIGGAGAQFFDNNGNPLSGGKIYTYEAGTTTPLATYTSLAGTTAHTNPIILDSAGRVPGGEIWLTLPDLYKFVLKTSTDVTIGTYDNIQGYSSGSIAYAATEVQIATAGQTLFVLTEMFYNPGTNTLGVYIDGVNQVVNNSYVESTPTSVTFMSGLHVGAVVKFVNLNVASADASEVTYEPGFTGSVATTVAAKLQQTVSVIDFGAVGDGATDDTAAIQLALDATENGELYFPAGQYKITSALAVNARMTIRGAGLRQTYITCYGCNGFDIANGVNFITMTDLSVGQNVRYTVTPNAYTGINILGTSATQSYWHTYRNVFVDGFDDAIYGGAICSSVFDNCTVVYSHHGLVMAGQCLNNVVTSCRFGEQDGAVTPPTSGSYGIKAGDDSNTIEGLMITNCLIGYVERAVWCIGAIDVFASNNIIESASVFGFVMQSGATYPSLNNIIDGNYIGMRQTTGSAGVYLANNLIAFDDQNRGTKIVNNEILAYSGGSTVDYGILIDGTAEKRNLISGNSTFGCTVADCRIATGLAHRVSDNLWRSLAGGGFYTVVPVQYINNTGIVSSTGYPSPQGLITPTVIGTTTAGVGTYTTQIGYYKIIDNLCYFSLRVTWTAHTGTGNMKIAGLPVACRNVVGYSPAVTLNVEDITFPAGATSLIGIVNTGLTTIELRGSGTGLAPTPVAIDASGSVNISGFYDIS